MSIRSNLHSVTSNSKNDPHINEEIFLQPIDQQYEKTKDTFEFQDAAEFFIEYEQKQNMNKIINMIIESEFSTDSESYSTVSKSLEKVKDDNFSKPKCKKISFTKSFLVEKWKKNAEEFIKNQTKIFLNCSVSQLNPNFANSNNIRMSDPERRPINFFNNLIENDFVNEMKLSNSLYGNQKSIYAVNHSYLKSPFI